MEIYRKYTLCFKISLKELGETVNQINNIKNPTKLIKDIKDDLDTLNSDLLMKKKKYPNQNYNNIQLTIFFYDD